MISIYFVAPETHCPPSNGKKPLKKKFLVISFIFLLFNFAYQGQVWCNSPDQNLTKSEHIFYGVPNCEGQILERTGYVLCYDKETKNAAWASYHLTNSDLPKKGIKRSDDFRPDPDLQKNERAELKDYRNSGFDKGHLVPAQDMSRSKLTMSESFLLSNMTPQIGPNFNRGIWKQLETDVRKWAKKKKSLHIFTGPLYLDDDGNITMLYKVIGPDKVAIPTHFYKIIVADLHPNKELDAIAFILPNKENPVKNLPLFITTIDEVEKDSGIDFLKDLDDIAENNLEAKKAPALW